MEPVALQEDVILDKHWRNLTWVDIGTKGKLVIEGDDVAVYLFAEPPLAWIRFLKREFRIGTLAEPTAKRIIRQLDEGRRFLLRVSDLPFPIHAPTHLIRVSIWMESDNWPTSLKGADFPRYQSKAQIAG
jgi:hypothetical protein